MLTDDLPLDLLQQARDARVGEPEQKVSWRKLKNCLHCQSRTWPMERHADSQRREQCLHCGQRYLVKGQATHGD
jgi:DNA-directed RNA polymerase subunit RPC12/RpoP